MKNRCILSLLLCGMMLYYAMPRLELWGGGAPAYFSWGWLAFLLMAVAGNLAAVLYTPAKKSEQKNTVRQQKQKVRAYSN